MKRWAIGSIAFLLTVGIGFAVAELFDLSDPTLGDLDVNGVPAVVINKPEPAIETRDPEPALEIIEERRWPDNPHKIKLITTGEGFHGDEVEAKNGEKWLGLIQEEGQYHLREVRLKVTRVVDEVFEGSGSKNKTGKSVALRSSGRSIFLLKNARFPIGEVRTLFVGKTWEDVQLPEYENFAPEDVMTSLKENFSQAFHLGNETYVLRVIRAVNPEKEQILALVLESGNTRQVLHTMGVDANSDVGTLYWVGDIDRDGKPDLYLSLFEHYNVDNSVFLISSEADKGKLLKQVARFWTTGC